MWHSSVMIRGILKPLPDSVKVPLRGAYRLYALLRRGIRDAFNQPREIHVVVCGFPRSGTSLLYNMLSAALPEFEFEQFETEAVHPLQRPGNRASKSPLDVLRLEAIAARNVHGKRLVVLILVRDPRDLITSRHPMIPDRYFIGYDHSWWPANREFSDWNYDAPGVSEIHEAIIRSGTFPGAEIALVRFEDLVSDPDGVQQAISKRAGIDFTHAFSSFHTRQSDLAYRYEGRFAPTDSALVRETSAVDPSRSGKWRADEHHTRLVDQFTMFPGLFDVVEHYGYSQDRSWFEAIQGEVSESDRQVGMHE